MPTTKKAQKRPRTLGTVLNPFPTKPHKSYRFDYAEGTYFEVRLEHDGALSVRITGQYSDLLTTEHHVANAVFLRPRRWNGATLRFESCFTPPPKAKAKRKGKK